MSLHFDLLAKDGQARAGKIALKTGTVNTPVFMPVGTLGAMKSVLYRDLQEMNIEICLANTYHLYLRPGVEVLKKMGGLKAFNQWQGLLLTDSGGFQVFSLSKLSKISDDGYAFQSHIDGSRHFFDAEKVLDIQKTIGSDIVMPLDQCLGWGSDEALIKQSVDRSIQWLKRSIDYKKTGQSLFGIVQGEGNLFERERCARAMVALDCPGYSIGGLSVGEDKKSMKSVLEHTLDFLPEEKPRYLMGVGSPEDLLMGMASGVDMFDCVLPTRNARNATVYTFAGKVLMRKQEHQMDESPIESDCDCLTCKNYSRAYLRHLFKAGEFNALTLASIHNLRFFQRFMQSAREAIMKGEYTAWMKEQLAVYPYGD